MTFSTSQPGGAAPPNARAMRILVVDDHADTREGLRRMLERSGHHVKGAGTCADALATAAEMSAGRLDVVVSDVGLPDGDGVELMQTIMSRHACRAVALTGWGGADDLKRYAAAGIDRSFVKPVAVAELLAALDALVGGG
jgi:two-component system NtrC family sensor kinase